MPRYGVLEDLLARGEHQRADDAPGLHGDARQAAQAGAAQQVDEEGLDRVVGVVGHRHRGVALRAAQLVEPGVAQPPRGHLHRLARALHLGRRLEAAVVEGHAPQPRLLLDQQLVLVALGAPQLEVAVGDPHAVARAGEEVEQHHRVDAPRDGEQDAVVGRRQLVALDIAAEGFEKGRRHTAVCYRMFTSVSIAMPNRSPTACCTRRAKAITSPPVAPPRLTSTSACRSCTPTRPSA